MSAWVFLIGPPGVGKTTVGRALAERLSRPFRDLDAEIALRVDKTVPELLVERGEESFRRVEAETLQALTSGEPLVLACGGGTPCRAENWARMKALGVIIGLEGTLDTLVARTEGGDRPLLRPSRRERLSALLAERASCYARADLRVGTDGREPDDVVAELAGALANAEAGDHVPVVYGPPADDRDTEETT